MAARDVTLAQGVAGPVPARNQGIAVAPGRLARRSEAAALIVLMVIGSVSLPTAVPLGGLWVASQLTESFLQPSTASVLVALLGIPAAMGLTGKGLAHLERRHRRVTGTTRRPRMPAYQRSISDSSPDASALEILMTISVLAGAVAFAGWFLLLPR